MNNIYKLLLISCLTFGSVQANIFSKIATYSLYLIKLDKDSDKALDDCQCKDYCDNCKSILSKKKELNKLMYRFCTSMTVIGSVILIYTAIKIKQNPKQLHPVRLLKNSVNANLNQKLLSYFHR